MPYRARVAAASFVVSAVLAGLAGRAAAERPGIESAEFGLLGSFAIPTADFAGTSFGDGFAKPGLGVGFDFLAHLTYPYVAWSTSTLFFWNPQENEDAPPSVDLGAWLNIPLLTGVRLQTPVLGGTARFYGQLQAGVNLASHTDFTDSDDRIEVDWGSSFGFCAGAGAILLGRIHLGLRVFNLGEPEYRLDAGFGRTLTVSQEPRLMALMLGINFDATN